MSRGAGPDPDPDLGTIKPKMKKPPRKSKEADKLGSTLLAQVPPCILDFLLLLPHFKKKHLHLKSNELLQSTFPKVWITEMLYSRISPPVLINTYM